MNGQIDDNERKRKNGKKGKTRKHRNENKLKNKIR